MKIQLSKPFRLAPESTPITEVELREEITGADAIDVPARAYSTEARMGDFVTASCRLIKMPLEVFLKLPLRDFTRINVEVMRLFTASLETGPTT